MTDDDQRISLELQAHLDQQHSVSLWLYSHEAFTVIRMLQIAAAVPSVGAYARQVAALAVEQLAPHFANDPGITEGMERECTGIITKLACDGMLRREGTA